MLNKHYGLQSSTESMVPFILKRLELICVKRPMDFLYTYLYTVSKMMPNKLERGTSGGEELLFIYLKIYLFS